jgi:hypothetical protein
VKSKFKTLTLLSLCTIGYASNLANPASALPAANLLVGASYNVGGYTLTNLNIPAMFNRFHGRIEYAPITYLNIGIDLGATQIDVDRYVSSGDTIDLFHGNYGFSGGAHLKLSTPLILKKTISFFAIGQATSFSSKNDGGAEYGGLDGAGVIGLQFRIPNFGFISVGPMVYMIEGDAQGADGKKEFYSNSNNVRGWMAIDYYLKGNELSKGNAYLSVEFSASPKANYSSRIPIQEFSISVSLGYISGKIYGVDKEPR